MSHYHKIALVIASEGYQQTEYSVPKHVIEAAGIAVITVSDKSGTALAKDTTSTHIDLTLDEINISDYDGIFFIGGPGALDHLDNPTSNRIINEAVRMKKIVGAICISTRILAKAGVLTGKKATGWDGDDALEDIYKNLNVTYVPKDVVVDSRIITAVGPKAAQEFGQEILRLLPLT